MVRAIVHATQWFAMVEKLLHSLCCFECNSSFTIVRVKGSSKHVSSVGCRGKYCDRTPCRFHPFSKHPNLGGSGPIWGFLAISWKTTTPDRGYFCKVQTKLRESSSPPCDWKSSWRDFSEVRGGGGGVRAEVSGRGPRLLRSCLGVEISIRNPSEANFLEVCRAGILQTSKKSLQKRFHAEACPSTVLKASCP